MRGLLPKMINNFEIKTFRGKNDLINKIPQRIKGYSSWIPNNWKIFILIDRDNQDCIELKKQLEFKIEQSGMITRSKKLHDGSFQVINRIVIEELESWYFGDWQAVREAYPKVMKQLTAKYRYPDSIKGGTWEAFERILQQAGYFVGGLPKIEVARNIAPYMEPMRNISVSFCSFRDALLELQSENS